MDTRSDISLVRLVTLRRVSTRDRVLCRANLSPLLFFAFRVATILIIHLWLYIVLNKLQINKLRSLKSHGGVDRALLTFDLNVDLRPAFHWNIKQLFVFVVATYATDTNPKNEVVLWDKIVEAIHPNDMIIQEDNIIVKYALVDQGAELRGKEVQLRLMWDHMPLTGGLFMAESTNSSTFVLPTEYK